MLRWPWAKVAGLQVSERSQISVDVMRQYEEARRTHQPETSFPSD